MQSNMWMISKIIGVNCNDGYDDDSRNDDPSDDEYDIDNDSDYWRRAAD